MSSPEAVTDPTDPLVAALVERQYTWRIRHRYHDAASGREAAAALVQELLPESRLLRTEAGVLWLGPVGEFTNVYDVWAYDPTAKPSQVSELRDLAIELAGAQLTAGLLPGEPTREAFVDDSSFVLSATTMRLDLTGPVPGESLLARVELVPMTDDEVAAYRARAVTSYASERQAAGESAELAQQTSEATFDALLPGGRAGDGQYLFTVRHQGQAAGWLWVSPQWPAQVWIFDVAIDPDLRGKGLGAAALVHAAGWAREQGVTSVGLNVFGQNTHARSLYERLGYVVQESHWTRSSTR